MSAALKRAVQPIRPGELDKVQPGYWAAIVDGRVVAWARSLKELREIMAQKGFKRDEYGVIKVPSHDLLVV
ncbi:DUF5678 domain-containing protein [Aeropyrum camini]|uniref:DNA polymerase IV n=1 Tax=Aeropyrum camini SY1 = JCM 12091 TaxID=1198449 RepID=U3TB88_9CREN|nr:DUF5678 domain-containing protein [Aeropyrum camini]BAN89681.1 DNA polymerase IV [Aeropyrum camini SY1 = JCM 12091]